MTVKLGTTGSVGSEARPRRRTRDVPRSGPRVRLREPGTVTWYAFKISDTEVRHLRLVRDRGGPPSPPGRRDPHCARPGGLRSCWPRSPTSGWSTWSLSNSGPPPAFIAEPVKFTTEWRLLCPLLKPGRRGPHPSPCHSSAATHLALPDALAGDFGIVLFYRGSWCPYCNAQLRAFQRASESMAEVGAKVVARSVDDEATTAELVAKHGLTFPVGHSADAKAISARRAFSSTPSVGTSNPPGSSSTPKAGWSSASTPAAPSAGWCQKTSWA